MVDLNLLVQAWTLIEEAEKTRPDQRARACEILSEALELAKTIEIDSRVYKFIEIADTYAELNLTEKSLEVLNQTLETVQEMSYDGGRATQLSEVGKRFVAKGLIDRGFNLLEQALELAKIIEDVDERDLALCNIAYAYGEAGQDDFAFEIAALIEDEFRAALRVFSPLAEDCIQLGQHDRVLKIINAAEQIDSGTFVASEAIRAYATVKDYNRPLQFVDEIKSADGKISVLADIAKQHLKAGHKETALEILNRATAIAATIKDKNSRSFAHDLIDSVWAKAKE